MEITMIDFTFFSDSYNISNNINILLVLYLLVMNITGIAVMAIDKSKARHHAWRIPEKTLFLVSLLGGSLGTWAGMYIFRHKTRHWYFVAGMPAIFFIQIAALVYFLYIR